MATYSKLIPNRSAVPATRAIPGREAEMAQNDGGGVSFKTDKWTMLDRFTNLGAEAGVVVLGANTAKNQYRNYENVLSCIKEDGVRVVNRIVEISDRGLAHKNDHAVFVLALCFTHGDEATKNAAEASYNKVIRTGTHNFMLVNYISDLRGFGRQVRRAINSFYTSRDSKGLAHTLTKYQNREDWTNRDVFRMAHTKFGHETSENTIAKWSMGLLDADAIKKLGKSEDAGLKLIWAVEEAKKSAGDTKKLLNLVEEYKLNREQLPTEVLNKPEIQEALLMHSGGTALIRNLGNMSKSGLLTPLSKASKFVVGKLKDREFIKKGRLHPLSLLVAMRTYGSGHSLKGDGVWQVNPQIKSALEEAFYLSFDLVEPTGQNFFFGLDVSGSMGSTISGTNITNCEAAAVLAMTMVRTEPWTYVGGFASGFVDLGISATDSLESAAKKALKNNFGSTAPSTAIQFAIDKKMDVDAFVFITDNDINTGMQPSLTLKKYRKEMKKPNAKMMVCGLSTSNFSIADPTDPLQMDLSGFSPDMTSVITGFARS